ncbi:MAG TPA: magnesium transporter [Flavobacteriaceae bacterium]|jgi:magnesium transporter|nr:magnesium transporter [Flavobacteriaceae bacterium]HIB47277.1 magnesium transporter [Flavobacteriaceae bacterium]HIN98513.1 magnesium transporter [Flavobacteriaceae bacterium]|tara:strand:- start:92561 stop:93910 length:1350 start_codon:yes stop_codon:yes gene_type:complete
MQFQLTTDFIENVEQLIAVKDGNALRELLQDFHFADVAELLEELSSDDATYLIKLLESDITSEALMELDDDVREKILDRLSPSEIATELSEMDTDDAADVVAELDQEVQQRVIEKIEDQELAADIVELLAYDEDTAGALMAKELVQVKETWTVAGCVREMRRQAENVTRVHSIYVTNKEGKLTGRLSLKDLLTAAEKTKISEVFIPKVDYVTVHTDNEEVARIMQKYDLEAIPVVDEDGILMGRITIDDIVDFIKDEAEKDYQMAAGISQDVEADDSVWQLTRARLPWLVLGLFGGLGSVYIMQGFEEALNSFPVLFFFTPLIAAMAGNVGVQSSAIIVQGLANDNVKGSLFNRLVKEVGLALINGCALGLLVILFGFIVGQNQLVSVTIAVSMLSVIIVAALIGTFVPIILDKRGIDPAIATGPFITTSNDIFGIFLFFYIAKLILGF